MALETLGASAAELLDKVLQQSRQVVRPLLGNPAQVPYYRQEGTADAETPYLEAILLFTFACFVLEFYLDWRQYAKLKLDKPPEMVGGRRASINVTKELKAAPLMCAGVCDS